MFAPVRSSFALLLWMWGLAVPVYAQGPAVPLDLTSTTIVVAADASPREPPHPEKEGEGRADGGEHCRSLREGAR